ncbi:MAG: ribonuclease HI [Polyangiales bacterium]
MPWKSMQLRGQRVFVAVDAAGQPQAEGGRVAIHYRPGPSRRYHAAARNLSELPKPEVFPDGHCEPLPDNADGTVDTAASGAKSGLAGRRQARSSGVAKSGRPGAKRGRGTSPSKAELAETGTFPERPEPGQWLAYCDGACRGNPGPAGLGVVWLQAGRVRELSEYLGRGTNNIAELTAILRLLEALPDKGSAGQLYTDSRYAIGVLQQGWKAKANAALIARLRQQLAEHPDITLHYVPGHAGVQWNERADALARQAVQNAASAGWRDG